MRISPFFTIIFASLSCVEHAGAFVPAKLSSHGYVSSKMMVQTKRATKELKQTADEWIEENTQHLDPTNDALASASTLEQYGNVPIRSLREGKVGDLPSLSPSSACKITESTKLLSYVNDITDIDGGVIHGKEKVKAWVLENEHIAVKGVLLGGNLMGFLDKETNEEYLWLNKEGAVPYGPNSGAFPLERGLTLHGGIRMAAVTAEHGLYFDTDWDLDFEVSDSGDSASLIFSIQDTLETRQTLNGKLSGKGFSSYDAAHPMKNYPVTDAWFKFKVTLKSGEKFLRTECTVENTKTEPIQAEAWMPQTWPIDTSSQIISHQKKRRIKSGKGAYVSDSWVMRSMIENKYVASDMGLDADSTLPYYSGEGPFTTKNMEGPKDGWVVAWPPAQLGITDELIEQGLWNDAEWGKFDLNYPLQWPSPDGGITYDYPYMDGPYHAISFGNNTGRGMAYVPDESSEAKPHFTKMWSWGNKLLFNREEAAKKDPPLAAGRPFAEYYEPWASAFNTAFFELYQFPPGESSWEGRFVPITEGLDAGKKQHELQEVVDAAVADAVKSFKK